MDRISGLPSLTSTETADLLDVHPSTVKRWCNDGDLAFHKTDGGHRRITLGHALEFAAERGIGTRLAPFAPYEGHVWTALRAVEDDGSYERLLSLAMGWVHRGHVGRVERLFRTLAAHPSVSLCAFLDSAVRGLLVAVGQAWHEGRLRAGEEHLVSQAMIDVLLGMRGSEAPGRSLDPAPSAPTGVALVGTMEGNQHHIGALGVRLVLEALGWHVHYLGPDVPIEDFAALQKSRGADLVCVSLMEPGAAGDLIRGVRLLRELYDPECPYALAFGGSFEDVPDAEHMAGPFVNLGLFSTCSGFHDSVAVDWARSVSTEAA